MKFEVLKGLPPYGPMALPFPNAWSVHSEGLVVRFEPDTGEAWVGNFRRGSIGRRDGAFLHPNGRHVIVVSGGGLYVIDPECRRLVEAEISHVYVEDMMPLPDLGAIMFSDGFRFEAINSTGTWWRSSRISWDGFQNVRRDGMTLRGDAFDPTADGGRWIPFTLDLASGRCSDSVYELQMRGAIRIVRSSKPDR